MFLPGSTCGCCGGCDPGCPKCNPTCLLLTTSFQEGGGGSGGDGLCSEATSLTEQPIILRRGDACDIKITPSVVGNPSGSGAKVSVALSKATSSDGDYKYVSSVTLQESGSGYTNGARFAYSLSCSSSTCNVAPTIELTTGRVKPTLTASVKGGYNAILTPVMRAISTQTGEETWEVDSVTVEAGGTQYTDGAAVTFASTKATVATAAQGTIAVTRSQPAWMSAAFTSGGESRYASLSLSIQEQAGGPPRVWGVSGATIQYQYGSFTVGMSTQPSVPSGTVTVTPASITVSEVDEDGRITALTTTPGAYYATNGSIESVNVTNRGVYYTQDGVTSATLVDGGKFYYDNPCTYTAGMGGSGPGGLICAACPSPSGAKYVTASLTLGSTEATLSVSAGSSSLINATTSLDGKSCEGLSFQDNGLSASVSAIGCEDFDDPDHDHRRKQFCRDMPDSITLSLTGMGRLFVWSSRGGAYFPVMGYCEEEGKDGIFCGQCDEPAEFLRVGGTSGGPAGYSGSLIIQDCDVVCDLVSDSCGGWIYQGPIPTSASGSGINIQGVPREVDCGGGLDPNSGSGATVTISPTGLGTSVSIAGPRWGGETAEAEATVAGGSVSGINVTNGGSGYAREIIARVQPTVTASSQSTNGGNATFSVTLTSNGAEEPSWYVSSVSVLNGGTGYVGTEPLTFSVANGDSVEWGAWGYIIVGRTEPTLSASAPSGSGAVLSVSLSQTTDWQTGAAAWQVASVSVTNGGTGYTDGDSVTFTVDDGVEVQWSGASATITTGREEPEVTASVAWSSGSGASLEVNLQPSGSNAWSISGVTVAEGGSGYSQYDQIEFATDDSQSGWSYGYVSSVDQDGAITGITLYYSAAYWRSTGVIESVNVLYGGLYYKSTGAVESVRLEEGGQYVRFQPTGQVEVDTPAVTISSPTGKGATADAEVDQDLGSGTFGQVTSVSVTNGGEKYYLAGTGWIVNVALANLGHRQIHLSEPIPPDNPNPNPEHCDNFTDKWELIYGRISTQTCPTDLIGRSFKMALGLSDSWNSRSSWSEGFADYCVNPGNGYSTADGLIIFGFGGDITCTIQ